MASWPPAHGHFLEERVLRRGRDERLAAPANGSLLEFSKICPLDAAYGLQHGAMPADVRDNKRYSERGDFTIHWHGRELAQRLRYGLARHLSAHSLANAPDAAKDVMDTSRRATWLRSPWARIRW